MLLDLVAPVYQTLSSFTLSAKFFLSKIWKETEKALIEQKEEWTKGIVLSTTLSEQIIALPNLVLFAWGEDLYGNLLGWPWTLTHGDFHPLNVMKKEGTDIIAVIDLQGVGCQDPVIDLGYFLAFSMRCEDFEKNEEQLLRQCYNSLSKVQAFDASHYTFEIFHCRALAAASYRLTLVINIAISLMGEAPGNAWMLAVAVKRCEFIISKYGTAQELFEKAIELRQFSFRPKSMSID